jgi:hypothetical protein
MATGVGSIQWHDHQVSGGGSDLLLTTRADVALARLERMDQTDLDLVGQRGISAHSSITAMTAKAAATMT